MTSYSDFPTYQTFHKFHDLDTGLDLHRITSGFRGAFATSVASQQGTLTLPDTWFRPTFWNLLILQLLRPVLPNLPCLFSTFQLTQRRATLLLPTWIYSCQLVGTVNVALPFTTSVTILIYFHITNFPFLSSNIPSSPAYDVFISQLIQYARTCSSYECYKYSEGGATFQ